MNSANLDITLLLNTWRAGDTVAGEQLFAAILAELRQLARQQLRQQQGHTWQTSELVNEVYLRLQGGNATWQNRAHFFAVAATAARSVLVDHARRKQRQKRGHGLTFVTLDEGLAVAASPALPLDVLKLDDALRALEQFAPRQCRVVELRCFGGLTVEETADCLDIAPATVKRDWNAARRWLARELGLNAL